LPFPDTEKLAKQKPLDQGGCRKDYQNDCKARRSVSQGSAKEKGDKSRNTRPACKTDKNMTRREQFKDDQADGDHPPEQRVEKKIQHSLSL